MGELLRDAIDRGCRQFLVGIGGSATNDGGVGMLQELGFTFADVNGDPISPGARGLAALFEKLIVPDLACRLGQRFCLRQRCPPDTRTPNTPQERRHLWEKKSYRNIRYLKLSANWLKWKSSTARNESLQARQQQLHKGMMIKVLYKELINPVAPSGADPWVVKHNGKYYYCWSGGPGVRVKEIPSLDKISNDDYSQVYLAPSGTMYSAEYWAPELHYINGEWYIYVAADDGNNNNHRMYVLKGTSQDPTDPFEMIGQITDPTNRWAIDGTVVIINKELYFIWSGWIADVNVMQNIYIAHMSNPWTIDSERTLISDPTKSWERIGDPKVNEGPAALCHDGKVFIVYSASGSWTDDYCLGMLTYSGGDPLNRASWTKNSEPVFSKKIGVAYGPGHCSFTTAVDGSVWMVYHANLVSGTGWSGRQVWLSPVNFADDGTPVFEDGPSTRIERFPYAILSSAE